MRSLRNLFGLQVFISGNNVGEYYFFSSMVRMQMLEKLKKQYSNKLTVFYPDKNITSEAAIKKELDCIAAKVREYDALPDRT